MSILVTGASGFVGSALCAYLVANGQIVSGAVRKIPEKKISGVKYYVFPSVGPDTDWEIALKGIDKIVHCAARVHIMKQYKTDALQNFREVNVKGTTRLVEQALDNGIKRFIYMSSIKVNGENTINHAFNAEDQPAPVDAYSISKWEAEKQIQRITDGTELEFVIIRSPLIYGPDVSANFFRLMKIIQLGVPLPFGTIQNSRSLVALDNLIDLIATCLNHHRAANQTFLVSDGEDISTTNLLLKIGNALGKPARLIPVNVSVLCKVAHFCGRKDLAQRLCGSLQIDINKTCNVLEWSPSVSVDEALQKTVKYFLDH